MLDNYIETIPAQQRTGKDWFKGSADAVYQTMHVVTDDSPDQVCIFGGDHVYKMDVRQMLAEHLGNDADVTVAAIPVRKAEAVDLGVIETDAEGHIVAFHEKVADPPTMPDRPGMCLASMGNYIFKTSVLVRALEEDAALESSAHDFGKDILPTLVKGGGRVLTYDFTKNRVPGEEEGYAYWRDIGTVDAYWAAQMDLVAVQPAFNLYNQRWPLRAGYSHGSPPAKFVFRDEANARVGIATESLVSLGCIISGGRIHRSVLSSRVRVNSFSHIEECVLFENVVIGRHVKIRRAIIDKDVEIPSGTEIGYNLEADKKRWYVSEGGVVIIPKRAKLPAV